MRWAVAQGYRWDEVNAETADLDDSSSANEGEARTSRPLSPRALEILDAARQLSDRSGLLFVSPTGRTLSDSTLSRLLRAEPQISIRDATGGSMSLSRDDHELRFDVEIGGGTFADLRARLYPDVAGEPAT